MLCVINAFIVLESWFNTVTIYNSSHKTQKKLVFYINTCTLYFIIFILISKKKPKLTGIEEQRM